MPPLDTALSTPTAAQPPLLDAAARGHMPSILTSNGRGDVTSSLMNLMLKEIAARLADAERTIAYQRDRIDYLETLSTTDELTGLLNRRGFSTALRRELAACERHDQGGVLVMVDLDRFKQINDQHGHQAGDAYLREVGRVLRDNVRPQDMVARLGGDEFAVLLTRVAPAAGQARAAHLSMILSSHALIWGNQSLPLRASFGSTPFTADDREEEIVRRADDRMYMVKHSGRV